MYCKFKVMQVIFYILPKLAVDSVKIDSYEESACDFDQSQAEE